MHKNINNLPKKQTVTIPPSYLLQMDTQTFNRCPLKPAIRTLSSTHTVNILGAKENRVWLFLKYEKHCHLRCRAAIYQETIV